MEDKCDYVAEKQYPYHLTEAVVRRQIRHGQNTCADTVTDDNARRLKKVSSDSPFMFGMMLSFLFLSHFIMICLIYQ